MKIEKLCNMKKTLLKPEKIQFSYCYSIVNPFPKDKFLIFYKNKLTFTKLSKFKVINPPPVSFGGFKHFRSTNKYNDCVFDEP